MKLRIKQKITPLWLCILLSIGFFSSCEKDMDAYYKVPSWLKGSAYDVIESKGEHTLFLQAVERAGFTDLLKGKGIITIVAPSNAAFQNWLTKHQYTSLESVPLEELKKVVSYHFIYYSYDQKMLANYRPEGINAPTESQATAGLYYKFRTKSSDVVSEHPDKTVPPGVSIPIRKVYHKERFLPVLSSFLFQTKGIDPVSNYSYFYPTSSWSGEAGGFSISNASVDSYSILADNGYVYLTNEVLEPLETIYTELKSSSNHSLFLAMYDRFTEFTYDDPTTSNFGKGDSLFLYYHTGLPSIASEWTYNGEGGVPDYAHLAALARSAYAVFAPANNSIERFFSSFWAPYYSSIDKVPFIPIKYLLDNHVYTGDVVFPEEIEKGKILTQFGDKITFNTQSTDIKKMCVNGTLYGLNDLIVPRMFESVTAPVFQNPDYTIFLQMLDNTSLVAPLMSADVNINLFIPTDKLILENTTVLGNALFYKNINSNKFGSQDIEIESTDGRSSMSYSLKSYFAKNHIATSLISEVGNKKVYKTMNSYQYLLVEDNEKIYSTNIFNNFPTRPAAIKKLHTAYNGVAYEVSGAESMALLPDENVFKDQISKASELSPYYYFSQLVIAAGLHTTKPPFDFLQGERFIVFIPSNEAILAGFATIPFDDPVNLREFLKYYFVNTNESLLTDYPFPGAGVNKDLTTFGYKSDRTRSKLILIDNGNQLQVKDEKGTIVNVKGLFPTIYSDGAVYLIDGLLDFNK